MTRRTGTSIWTGLAILLQLTALRSAEAQSGVATDAGKYLIRIQDSEYGTDTFTSDAASGSESEIAFRQGGRKASLHISVRSSGGLLKTVETTAAPGGRFVLTAAGGSASLGTGESDQKSLQMKPAAIPKRVFPYCSMAPEQLRPLLASYNTLLGGPQTFHIVYSNSLGPGGLIQGVLTINLLGLSQRTVAGTAMAVMRFHAIIPSPTGDMDAEISADQALRVLLFRIPTQRLVVVREGVRDSDLYWEPEAPGVAVPSFQIKVERNVRVPMRDGVSLAADIYRPDAQGRFPVILQRTCRGRRAVYEASFFARRGYVYVAQDVRGRYDSEGDWRPWINEARDGADTLEWCGIQHWSNGNVGMIGESYAAYTQWAAARERNRHLKCMVPIASMPESFIGPPDTGGVFRLLDAVTWARAVEGKSYQPTDTAGALESFRTLPVSDVDTALFGSHIELLQKWLRDPGIGSNGSAHVSSASGGSLPDIPILQISGWFDANTKELTRNFQAMNASRHKNQKLICGPWTQVINSSTHVGHLDFGLASIRDFDVLALRWFDQWLKDANNDVDREPPVEAFVTGANRWQSFTAWPPREAKQTRWYLHSDGKANSDRTGGTVSLEKPMYEEPPDHYDYDPLQPFVPVSMRAGNLGSLFGADMLSFTGQPDVLTYSSLALDADMAVAGPIEVQMTAASTAPDADWFAALLDVSPNGSSSLLAQGIVHSRMLKPLTAKVGLDSDGARAYLIQLGSICHSFKKGHRFQLALTSSCFPTYARNLNTGKDRLTTTATNVAHQTVYHTMDRPSYITLPVLLLAPKKP